jgi:hypothetical protein
MKSNMETKKVSRDHRRDRSSEAELRAIVALNQDRTRQYPAIDHHPRSYRTQIVYSVLPHWPNKFHLIRATTKLARMLHDFNNARVAHTINAAIQVLTPKPTKKPSRPATASSEAA